MDYFAPGDKDATIRPHRKKELSVIKWKAAQKNKSSIVFKTN